jgi:exosortase
MPSWKEHLGTEGLVKILVLAGLFAWLYWEHLYRLYAYWLEPDWSHGFLMPFFCLYLINEKKSQIMLPEYRGSILGLFLVILSIAIYVLSVLNSVGYTQPLSMVAVIAGLVLLMCGWRTVWVTAFPIGMLVLAIPPPERLYRQFTQPLQQGAAAVSKVILDSFPGAEMSRQGIHLSYYMEGGRKGEFTVAGACSGMRSLMAFVALGLMMAYFAPRPFWHRIVMALLVIPVALFCNVLRVVITGSFQMYDLGELAVGTPHMVLGFLMFGLGFAIYLAALWLLDHLFVETPEDSSVQVDSGGAAT